MPDGKVCPEQFRGWLLKWTNYIKGYQRRWFVLSNGFLSYYRSPEEMVHACRGTINLAAAFIDTIDSTNFMITNGPSQVYHLRALNEVERQRWVTALELAKAKAIKKLDPDSGSEDEVGGSKGASVDKTLSITLDTDDNAPLAILQLKLKELTTAYELVLKNSDQLAKFVSELESGATKPNSGKPVEKLAMLKITSAAIVKAAEEFTMQARSTERRWSRALQHEHSLRLQLQENMEALANQMHGLEDEARLTVQGVLPSFRAVSNSGATVESSSDPVQNPSELLGTADLSANRMPATDDSHSDDEDKFFDALEMSSTVDKSEATLKGTEIIPPKLPSDCKIPVPSGPSASFFETPSMVAKKRRSTIPPRPNHKLSLWTFVKNAIGKDISKIPMPVNFNEPLSLLQRMSEDMLYSSLLSKAAQAPNTMEEAAYVAAFINSPYAITTTRINKPFNPLLFETFEFDCRCDPEFGWRLLAEQVSHHPPMFAMHVEHKDWTFWQEYTVAFNLRGKYVACYPLGSCHLVMHASKSHYTWTKVTTTIHNIIVGRLWIDQSGDLKLTNHTTGELCSVKYHAYSYFSREQQRKITGSITDASGVVRYLIKGHWDQQFIVAKVLSGTGKNVQTTDSQVLWKADPIDPACEARYGFSEFVCSMNEPEEGVAPTDCRLRPDIRVMEEQDFDKANTEKVKLEEKQRARRRKREAMAAKAAEAAAAGNLEEAERLERASTISPVWFSKEYDPFTKTMMHVYKGGYWEAKAKGNWHELNLPEIY